MKCVRSDYPISLWIKQSFVFSLTTTSLLALAAITTADALNFRDGLLSVGISFLVIVSVALSNLWLHVYFKVEDPVKSPLFVKLLSFAMTIGIVLILHLLERYFDIKYQDQNDIVVEPGWRLFLLICIQSFLLNFIVLLWLYFLMSEHVKVQHQLERSRLEKSREEAFNMMLRQQIQPHFLFNALATLKSLIRKDPGLAENYLLQLSDFLRISIAYVKNGELTSVKQEIKLCEDYLNMQKMRFGEALHFHIQISPDIEHRSIPIFSIQPLVDNALKHNNFTNNEPIMIEIKDSEDWIIVRNNKNIKIVNLESNGSGLKNLRERYKNLAIQGIEIEESDSYFEVKIKIV